MVTKWHKQELSMKGEKFKPLQPQSSKTYWEPLNLENALTLYQSASCDCNAKSESIVCRGKRFISLKVLEPGVQQYGADSGEVP